MRILFTGATSFTGMWFATGLAQAGHDITAAIHRGEGDYSDVRAQRLERVREKCRLVWRAPFGTPQFLDLLAEPFDLLCHHAAEVTDYKSPDFQIERAVTANTRSLIAVLDKLRKTNCRRVVLTGSVFEVNEGKGTMPLQSFSPYGTSKALTAEIFRQETLARGMALGKFVITNPFGPYEEPRFTDYLMRCWKDGQTAKVNTPAYVRDNIPVTLMAAAYARFVGALPDNGFHHCTPSYYAESQGAFAQRFAAEIRHRLPLSCTLDMAEQVTFSEPQARVGTDILAPQDFGWSEQDFWDKAALYYAEKLGIPTP